MSRETHLIRKRNPLDAENVFAAADAHYAQFKQTLLSQETRDMEHAEVERLIERNGCELLRLLFQDHLVLRAHTEGDAREQGPVVGSDGIERSHRRKKNGRGLMTIFGPVAIRRAGYGARGSSSLYPLDAELNLPDDRFSHGVREHVARGAAKNSFEETVECVERTTGARLGKRQAEQLARKAAHHFNQFYKAREEAASEEQQNTGEIMVVSFDGKGVCMRREALREKTRQKAEKAAKEPGPPKKDLKRNKRHAKRMAAVAATYTIKPYVRKPEDIVRNLEGVADIGEKRKRPKPENKRVWASLVDQPNEVIADAFDEGLRRDPGKNKRWVALVDGNESQMEAAELVARKHDIELKVILDIIHVIEYLWDAARVLAGEPAAERDKWVRERLLGILQGKCTDVAAGMRRSATLRKLSDEKRKPVDTCADYLLKYQDHLRYNEYLAEGLPIATGVIEGACRHLVEDRMGITGARWGLEGAEAVLRLRALHVSGDFDDYWQFHLKQEKQLNHTTRYAGETPRAHTSPPTKPTKYPHLRLVG